MEYTLKEATSGAYFLKPGDYIQNEGKVTEFNGHTVQWINEYGCVSHSQISWLDGWGRLTNVGKWAMKSVGMKF